MLAVKMFQIVLYVIGAFVLAGFIWWLWKIGIEKFTNIITRKSSTEIQSKWEGISIFASYSHKDNSLVHGLVHLYQATDQPVFRDEESIKPGQKWRIEINRAIEQCQTVLVFWCCHSSQSSEVRAEYEKGIHLNKRVVPVLMDQTELPKKLREYQYVDLRKILGNSHDTLLEALNERESMRNLDLMMSDSEATNNAYDVQKQYRTLDQTLRRILLQIDSSINIIQ
jgi:hypothetical protein